MATGTFITLGFGIAAVLVGLLTLLTGMNFLTQVILWIILSVGSIALIFKYYKEQPTISSSGQSDHGFDTLGTVIQDIKAQQRGEVRFDTPVLGNSVWKAISDQAIANGDRVSIVEVNGQLIKVVQI
jgi:membrane protein implicated in regulation of membrane protease activity